MTSFNVIMYWSIQYYVFEKETKRINQRKVFHRLGFYRNGDILRADQRLPLGLGLGLGWSYGDWLEVGLGLIEFG